eukprot:4875966-Pyramimonas_sp.AAC.1
MGPRSAVLGGCNCRIGCAGRMWALPLGASVELPMGATKRCTGCVKMSNCGCGTHAGGLTGGFGGAPHGAAKRCIG